MYGTESEEVINIVAFIQKEHKKKSKKRIYMLFKKDETKIDKTKQLKHLHHWENTQKIIYYKLILKMLYSSRNGNATIYILSRLN